MSTTLYVSNVGLMSDLNQIEDLFMTVGDVMAHSIEHIPESGRQGTFGVFEMSTEQQAADCIDRFNGQSINGRQFAIVSQRPKPRAVSTSKKVRTRGQ